MNKNLENMLNDQFNRELFAVNAYLGLCSYFRSQEMDGFANFFKVQSEEEAFHAEKIFNFIHDIGGRVTLLKIEAPTNDFKDILDAMKTALSYEEKVTKDFNTIARASLDANDFATHIFLQWFITEQVEEEALFNNLIKKIQMIGDNSGALFLLNNELAQRTFTKPKV
jgi:ferritin